MNHPNLLLIVVDCLRSDYLVKERGNAQIPFLDAVRSYGVTFTDVITVTSFTTPSFTSMLTGLYLNEHGVRSLHGQHISSDHITLAEHLKQSNYSTYGFVTGPLFPSVGLSRGFDIYEYRESRNYLTSNWGNSLRNRIIEGEFEEPWFILLHLWELHQPRQTMKNTVLSRLGSQGYESSLSLIDSQIETLWGALTRSCSLPIIAAITGDHGEWIEGNPVEGIIKRGMARLSRMTKRHAPKAYWHGYHVYDFLIRVPLVVWATNLTLPGRLYSHQIRQIDLFPTFCELLGVASLPNLTGRSFWPLVYDRTIEESPAYIEASGGHELIETDDWLIGIRYKGWKFAFSPNNPSKEPELYHLRTDPYERINLISKHSNKAEELRNLIESEYIYRPSSQFSKSDEQEIERRLRDLGYY